MNKKEQAAFDELEQKLRLAKAFSWTSPVAPDLAPPTEGHKLSRGYTYHTYSTMVQPACSSRNRSYRGAHELPELGLASTGGIMLYSTKLLALKALRHEVEHDCARRLASIDKQIEHELALDASPNGTA